MSHVPRHIPNVVKNSLVLVQMLKRVVSWVLIVNTITVSHPKKTGSALMKNVLLSIWCAPSGPKLPANLTAITLKESPKEWPRDGKNILRSFFRNEDPSGINAREILEGVEIPTRASYLPSLQNEQPCSTNGSPGIMSDDTKSNDQPHNAQSSKSAEDSTPQSFH